LKRLGSKSTVQKYQTVHPVVGKKGIQVPADLIVHL